MGHVLHAIAQPVKKFGHYALDVAAVATGNPELVPLIEGANSGIQTYAQTGNLGSALKSGALSAGGSYIGSNIGASLLPDAGTVGGTLSTVLGKGVGATAANAIGANLANVGIGALAGGFAGNSIASSFAPQGIKGRQASVGQPTPFSPKQDNEAVTPPSLQALGGLSPLQQATNVASGGVYGGGNGPDEQSFFANLINRQLVDKTGNVSDINTLNPIENSYLKQIGLGGYGNSTDLLQAISKFKPS